MTSGHMTRVSGPRVAVTPAVSRTESAKAAAAAFYRAFARRDASAMVAAYAPNVKFKDPLFGALEGRKVMEMWNTILPAANPKTFQISFKVAPNAIERRDGSVDVKVHWDARYDLGKRHVDNSSNSTLRIKDGTIVAQKDEWDLDNWTRQALPFGGGTRLGDHLAAFAAHAFIEVKDLLTRDAK